MVKKNNQKNYWFVGGLVVFFLIVGINQGWFTQGEEVNQIIPESQVQSQILGSCFI